MNNSPTVVVTPRAREWIGFTRPLIIAVSIMAVLTSILILFNYSPSDGKPLSPINPTRIGAQAVARVIEHEGVKIRYAKNAQEALQLSREPNATLLVIQPGIATKSVTDSLSQVKNLVLVDTSKSRGVILPGLSPSYHKASPDTQPSVSVDSSCNSPIAQRARSISYSQRGLTLRGPHWTGCFQVSPSSFLFAETTSNDGYRAVITDPQIFENSSIAKYGNASLAMGVLGRTPTLVWYTANTHDEVGEITGSPPATPTPPWLTPVVLCCFLTLLTFGIAKGRRLGRLVMEDFVTPVPAAETLTGQGRLMEAGKTRDFAARTLRRDTADRIAQRLRVPKDQTPYALREAMEIAGIAPTRMDAVLWGPPPQTDSDLVEITYQLKQLEKDLNVR